MATAEGGAAANTTSSSYGGGGAGGKFRKKPFRRQTTPYDRPLTALRGNNISENSSSSWLTKLVVEPASKLISYGADRFFASVFRKRLPPPPPSQPQDVNADVSDEDQVAGLDDGQDCAQEPRGDDRIQPINSSRSNVVLELEKLLKQKTFTRSEIVHLRELLQSRAVEVSLENASPKNGETGSDLGRHQEFASVLLEGNRNGGTRSSPVASTPVHNSEVLEDDIASPAEVAKAYMGSRPSKVSPLELGMRSQLLREDAGLLITMPFASKSPVMSMTKKTSVGLGAPENGFITPRSRSRSAIYSMARTPYSRVRPTSILKGSGINNNGHARPSTASPLSLVENIENFESQPVTLKRRSSVLDDSGGSVGPIRRIRQKSSLLGPRSHHFAHGVGFGSPSNQKPDLSREQRNKALTNTIENENESVPSTSYAPVRSRSSEVGSRILQQLEDLVSKEKSSDSKLSATRGKLPLKSSLDMISGQSLRSTKDIGSSKLLLDVHGDDKFGDKTNAMPLDAHVSSPEKQGKLGASDPQTSAIPSIFRNSVLNIESAVSLKVSAPGIGTCDSAVNHEASWPPQKMRAFRMSAEEDSVELDDVQCNGLASRSLSEKKGAMGFPLTSSNLAPVEAVKLVKPTVESKVNSPSSLISSRTNEVRPGAIKAGEGMSVVAIPASEETKTTLQSEALASSFAASNKPSEANNPPPLFNFRSKVADKILSLPMASFRSAEHETGRCSSSNNISVSIGSEVKAAELDKGSRLNLSKPGEINGNCDDVSSPSSNGSIFSSPSLLSFPAASTRDASQVSTAGSYLFASSTSITNSAPTGTDTPSTSSGSIFGLATKPTGPDGAIFKFGSSVDPLTAAASASTMEFVMNTNSGSLSSSASSGSSGFGLGSFPNSIGNNLQSSLIAGPNKPPLSDAATISEGTSTQLFSSTSAPAFNVSSRSSLPTFGFSSLVSSSSATSFALVGGPTSTLFDIGSGSTAANSSTSASISIFSSSLSSSSSSSATITVGSSSGTAPSFFNSGGSSSSTPSLLNNNSISFTSGTSGILNFGGSSSASMSSSSLPSTVFGSTFTPPSPSAGFTFGGPSTSCPSFSFTTSSASALSSQSIPNTQPIFCNTPTSGGPGNDQMNAEDSMAEDPAPSPASRPVLGQPSVSPSPPGFGFGSTVQSQSNPFIFGGQQNQVAPQNLSPPPFQATGSLEFNAGGGFSLGSGGGDKSGRKIVKISRNKNRKK